MNQGRSSYCACEYSAIRTETNAELWLLHALLLKKTKRSLDKWKSILVGCFSILLLGSLHTSNHLHKSLSGKPLIFSFGLASHDINCSPWQVSADFWPPLLWSPSRPALQPSLLCQRRTGAPVTSWSWWMVSPHSHIERLWWVFWPYIIHPFQHARFS